MRKRTLSLMPIFAVAAIAAMSTTFVTAANAETADAKELFIETHKCNMCHAVPAADIEAKTTSDKMKGPDLGGKVEADLETLAAYMRKTGELDGKEHKKEFKGTDEELQAIVDWLGSLEAK